MCLVNRCLIVVCAKEKLLKIYQSIVKLQYFVRVFEDAWSCCHLSDGETVIIFHDASPRQETHQFQSQHPSTNISSFQLIFIYSYVVVVLATDQVNARSILMYQQNLDKIAELSSHSAMGVSGPNCDLVNFSE